PSMINIEDLIKPISADKPCGEDFSYHPSFLNLQTIAKGKPETQFSPAEDPDKPKAASSGPDLNQIQAAFRDGGPETAQATVAFVNEAIGHADGIDSFLDKTLGAGQGVNFEALKKLLGEMKHAVEPYIPDAPTAASEEGQAAAAEPGAPARAVAMQGLAGTIQSRADVPHAPDRTRAHYDA